MISRKKLLQLAWKWWMAVAIRRKRISLGRSSSKKSLSDSNEASPVAVKKGDFAIYTTGGSLYVIPMVYLGNEVIRDLFVIAEEEFGIPVKGPIVVPIDASSMVYINLIDSTGFNLQTREGLVIVVY